MKSQFENLPEHIVQKILEFFQTKKILKTNDQNDYGSPFYQNDYQKHQLFSQKRLNLINGSGIKTDIETLIKFSMVCKNFHYIINKSNTGKLILATHYLRDQYPTRGHILEHISYCTEIDCKNMCHYVNKDVKYSNLVKKIAISEFINRKKTEHKEDLVNVFGVHLTNKQIESYYKIKKNANKLKVRNETSKFSKSELLDSI